MGVTVTTVGGGVSARWAARIRAAACHHQGMSPSQLVRGLYQRYQDRDWDAAASLLSPGVVLRMPATWRNAAVRGPYGELLPPMLTSTAARKL